ncbi:hypothetical protein [Rhodococcus qingshengii]|uniref:hypothetical protein n=1 Tax=Rhodococcus qingshengii TaxID=334542 RepID=UPI0035DA488A
MGEKLERKAQKKKMKTFIKELNRISQHHQIFIGGSGDCGSPWIHNKKGAVLEAHLVYCDQHMTYGFADDHYLCADSTDASDSGKKDVTKFLEELTQISNKYQLMIGGCGDHGSPYVSDSQGKILLEDVYYCDMHNGYGTLTYHISC